MFNFESPPGWVKTLFERMNKPLTPEALADIERATQSDRSRLAAAVAATPTGPNRTEIHATEMGIARILVYRNGQVSKKFTVRPEEKKHA